MNHKNAIIKHSRKQSKHSKALTHAKLQLNRLTGVNYTIGKSCLEFSSRLKKLPDSFRRLARGVNEFGNVLKRIENKELKDL